MDIYSLLKAIIFLLAMICISFILYKKDCGFIIESLIKIKVEKGKKDK